MFHVMEKETATSVASKVLQLIIVIMIILDHLLIKRVDVRFRLVSISHTISIHRIKVGHVET